MARFQIPNGRLAIIRRPDGRRIACGNNEVIDVDVPAQAWTSVMQNAAACGFHGDVIAKSQYVVLPGGGYGRHLIDGPVSVPDEQLPGANPVKAVAARHLVSSANGQHFIDGQPVGYAAAGSGIDCFDGQHYGYKPQVGNPWPFVVRNVWQQEVARITDPISNAVVFTDASGDPWTFANLSGAAHLWHKSTHAHAFQTGEFAGAISFGPDVHPWAWTVGQFSDGSPFICGRPFNDLTGPGIVLRGLWWNAIDVFWKDGRWILAGFNNDTGTTDVDDAVDPAQPREALDLTKPDAPTDPPPVDPPTSGVPCVVRSVTLYANGDRKVTIRVPESAFTPPISPGDTIVVSR